MHLAIGTVLLVLSVVLVPRTAAQDKPPPDKPDKPGVKKLDKKDEYPDYFKQPETVQEYWDALQFELGVGRPDIGARLLRELVKRAVNEQELVDLDEKVGTSAFLRLRLIPKWSDDPKANEQAIKDADDLAGKVSKALQNILGNRERIAKFVKNLNGDREEHDFAAKELYRSRAQAIPPLIDELRTAKGEERDAILALLPGLSRETVAPLMAALDIPDDALRGELIDVLVKRGAREAAPNLWYFADARQFPDRLRKKAKAALAYLTDTEPARLLPAPIPLTREAERYYRHQVPLEATGVLIWRWDPKTNALVTGLPDAPKVTASRAEEYYGLRFAQQALDIDPRYVPAQQVLLALALEKGVERSGLDAPLGKGAADVQELIASVNPDLVDQVLDRALTEKRLPVVLGAVRALGDLAETRALKPSGHGEPALVRALNYPDRRVQMAAADALLRIPGAPSPTAAGRVVDVLRRAAAIDPQPRAKPTLLIGFADEGTADAVAQVAQQIGFVVVKARSGKEALVRLKQAADVDAVLIGARLPDPGLASVLAQLRQDPALAGLPLWIVTPFDTQESLRERQYEIDEHLRAFRKARQALQDQRERTERNFLSAKGKEAEPLKIQLAKIDKELESYSQVKEDQILAERKRLGQELLAAPPAREAALQRLVGYYTHTWLLPEGAARDAALLKRALAQPLADAVGKPLSDAERKDQAETALRWLDHIARGELAGYDFLPAEDALYRALRSSGLSDSAVTSALAAIARLPVKAQGDTAQTELAGVVGDAKRSTAVRVAAATDLLRHMQRNRPILSPAQIQSLETLRAAKETDGKLREAVALVIGATRPNARLTGERLRDFEPRLPAAAAPPAEKPAVPDKPEKPNKPENQ